jgi:hypothetical protein
MRRLLFTLILFSAPLALATTVYKWVDENGVVHYSDQPHPNAEKVQVQGVQTFPASSLRGVVSSAQSAQESQGGSSPHGYQGCAITQPGNQQTIENSNSTPVSVQTDPPIRNGDQIYITLDGQVVNNGNPTGVQYGLTGLDRGEHTIQATVRGQDNAVLCQTPAVTFYVRQPSVASPTNPVRPH